MILSEDQFKRQLMYENSLFAFRKLMSSGLLTADEFEESKSWLIAKYNPLVAH